MDVHWIDLIYKLSFDRCKFVTDIDQISKHAYFVFSISAAQELESETSIFQSWLCK